MTQPALQPPDPSPQALQPAPDDSARPVVVALVLDPQQRLLSWRRLTLAEAAVVIALQSTQDFQPVNG